MFEADESDSDESESLSVVDPEFAGEEVRADPELQVDRVYNFHAAFHSLEGVDVLSMFETRAHVMKTVPGMRGVLRGTFRLAIDEALAGWITGNVNRQERGVKLFFLIPRMLLYRPVRGGTVSHRKLQDPVDFFNSGLWVAARGAKDIQVRKNRRDRCGQKKKEPPVPRSWRWQAS